MKKLVIGLFIVAMSLFVYANVGVAKEIKLFHDNPEWQKLWQEFGELSGKEIGVNLVPTDLETEIYKSRIKVDLTTSRAPAIFKWWFGYRAQELLKAGLLTDLGDVWDKVGNNFAPGVREGLTQEKTSYAFPLLISYWVWYYNKPLFEKEGLTLPKTWDEFMKLLADLKAKGIYGIGNSIGTSRWTAFIVFEDILYRIDVNAYNDLVNGKIHWTDPKVMQAMEIWKGMLEKGYFAPMDLEYTSDFPRMFKEGKLAFAPFGDWYGGILQQQGLVSGKDYGVFIPPAITPAGDGAIVFEMSPLVVGKNSPDVADAKKWFEWFATSPKAAQFLWEKFHFVVTTTHISADEIAKQDPTLAQELELIKKYPKALIRFWEATPVEIVEHAVDEFNNMRTDPSKYKEIITSIEAKAKEIWPKYGVQY
jgi:multiple sugar transport system substrate-binding protein